MKKFFLFALTTVSCVALIFSCTKKSSDPSGIYTCTCSYTAAGVNFTNQAVYTSASNEAKSSAQTQCTNAATALTTGGATGVSCHL